MNGNHSQTMHHGPESGKDYAAPADVHAGHEKHGRKAMSEREHHAMMIADFRRRFWISLGITVPILLLSPFIQELLRLEGPISFAGDMYVLWAFSSAVYFYGGYPFLKGVIGEMRDRRPAMMTLIGLAITVAYGYSAAVAFGLPGSVFFWELATLIDDAPRALAGDALYHGGIICT